MGRVGAHWPYVVKQCLSCGETYPKRRHRARGLCSPCHRFHQANNTLSRYREIPDDLQDGKLRLLLADPRRYVISVLGKTYADSFDEDTILDEAVRIFHITMDRWYRRTAYIDNPRPSIEEVLSAQADSTEYVLAPVDEPTPLEVFMEAWRQPVDAVWKRHPELGRPVATEHSDRWELKWGDAYRNVVLTVPKGDRERAQLEYQYEVIEYAQAPYTLAGLMKFAFSLAHPPTPYEAPDD